jgi:hypothetical protein
MREVVCKNLETRACHGRLVSILSVVVVGLSNGPVVTQELTWAVPDRRILPTPLATVVMIAGGLTAIAEYLQRQVLCIRGLRS